MIIDGINASCNQTIAVLAQRNGRLTEKNKLLNEELSIVREENRFMDEQLVESEKLNIRYSEELAQLNRELGSLRAQLAYAQNHSDDLLMKSLAVYNV